MAFIRAILWPAPPPLPKAYIVQQGAHLAAIRRANKAVADLRATEIAATRVATRL